MDRSGRQRRNHDYWEQAQSLAPLDHASRAEVLAAAAKPAEAYAEFELSMRDVAARYGNPSPQLELTRRRYIDFCWTQRDYGQVVTLAAANLRCKEARIGNLHPSLLARLSDLSAACFHLGRHHEGENYARQMLAIALMQPNPWKHCGDHALSHIATFAAARGDHVQSVHLLEQALQWNKRDPFADRQVREKYALKLAQSLEALGRFQEAGEVLVRHQPPKEVFAQRDLVAVFRYFWRMFNLSFRYRAPEDKAFDANIKYMAAALPRVGLRSDNRTLYFLHEMMKARLLKFRGQKTEAKQAYQVIVWDFHDVHALPEGMFSWALSDLAELWHSPDCLPEEEINLSQAIACLEEAGLARGPDYARLLNRLGLWHSGLRDHGCAIACYRQALAALTEGAEPRLEATLQWNLGTNEAAQHGFAQLEADRLAWRALSPGQPAPPELAPFVRLQGIFQAVYRRYLLALGPRHADTVRTLDFIQKSLS